jgi:hypothetical protein
MKADLPPPSKPGSSNAGHRRNLGGGDGQIRSPGSILKALRVSAVSVSVVASILEEQHYLHRVPAGLRECFAVYLDDEIHGAIVIASGGRQSHRVVEAVGADRIATLARLWLSDALPTNAESRVLGIILRQLRREKRYVAVVTHADPAVGHTGTIYRASGWLFLGDTEPGRHLLLSAGRMCHTRTAVSVYGSNRPDHLTATGVPAIAVRSTPKLRYIYFLNPAWRWRLKTPVLRYAEVQCRGPPEA